MRLSTFRCAVLVFVGVVAGCISSPQSPTQVTTTTATLLTVHNWHYVDRGHPYRGIYLNFSDETTNGRRRTVKVHQGDNVGAYRLQLFEVRTTIISGNPPDDEMRPRRVTYFTFEHRVRPFLILLRDLGDGRVEPIPAI